jgi:hypothetical protein
MKMSDIIQHIINYTLDELKEIATKREVYRKYPKNLNHVLWEIRPYLEKVCSNIEVSNLGNIKIDGKIVSPFEKEPGYFYVMLTNKIDYKVYRLVAETWCEFPFEDTCGWHVHHIVNDGKDNRPENLIWVNVTTHLNIHRN